MGGVRERVETRIARSLIVRVRLLQCREANALPIRIMSILIFDANSRTFRVMNPIWQSRAWPRFEHDSAAVASRLADAMAAIGEIRGLQRGLSADERETLALRSVVSEVIASFGIEGVQLDASEIEASVIASLKHRNRATLERRSDAIVRVMEEARVADIPLTANRLQDWHRLLFHGIEIEDRGIWRSFELDIVRSAIPGRDEVLYRAPPSAKIAQDMTVFLDWLSSENDLAVPVRAALAHLWFESIHPFSDGNGRIGRAIIEHVFARADALPFALSRQIEKHKRAYYAALQAGRRADGDRIDATAFVIWFLETIIAAADAAREETLFLLQRNRFFIRFSDILSDRQREVLERLFAQGPLRIADGLSARSYAKITKVSGPTATRDLVALEKAGALQRSEAGGRSTVYRIVFEQDSIT